MAIPHLLLGMGGASGNACVGVVYRKTDTSNYYAAWVDRTAGEVRLEAVVAGVATTVATASLTVPAAGEMRALVQGNRHRVWVDRVLRLDVEDSSVPRATKAGVYTVNTTAATLDHWYGEGV